MTVIDRQLGSAIRRGRHERVRRLLSEHPDLGKGSRVRRIPWLVVAARRGDVTMLETLLDLGVEIDAARPGNGWSALATAIAFDRWEAATFLLERGADPNLGRTLLAALSQRTRGNAVEYVRLLVENGADVALLEPLFHEREFAFTVLNRTTRFPEVVAYIRDLVENDEGRPGQPR